MRRLIIGLCFFFGAAGDLLAVTVDLYVDNRRACTGTAQVSGSDTTHVAVAAFANVNSTIFTANTDLQYMGIHFTAGTGRPAVTTPFKITAVDNTDPAHPILTTDVTMGTTPAADWEFIIFYGSNRLNTGASQTKGASSTGPVNEIHYALISSALSDQDVGHIHIRGNTGINYTGAYGASGIDRLIYSAAVGSTKSYILEGYVATAIPSDLTDAATKTSTYNSATVSNPDASVLSSAGDQLMADTTTTDQFPHIRYTNANSSVIINDPAATSPSLTLRFLKVTHPSTSGASAVVQLSNSSTQPNLSIDRCIIGSLDTTDDNLYGIAQLTTGFAPTNSITVSKSVILGRRYGIDVVTVQQVTVDQCYIENYGKDKDGNTVTGIPSIRTNNTTAAAYSAAMAPTNQVLRFTCTDNHLVHTATHSAASTTCVGIHVNKSVAMELCKIKGNKLDLYSRAAGISIVGCPSFDIQHNRITLSNATTHGVGIAVGADTSVEANPTGDPLLIVASGTNDANGSQVAAVDLPNPAHSTFKLTGGSATDDVYNGMVVYKTDTTSLREVSAIWDYDGTTKIAKCTPQFATTPASGVKWQVLRPRVASHGVIANNLVNSAVAPSTPTHAFGLFQGCDHVDFYGNTAIGNCDNGIVIKGEYNRVRGNRIYAGRGALLIKGGSFNDITNNTFYCANANGGTGCFDVQDKSNVHNMQSGETPLSASHWSKTTGNRITDNIFIVDSANNTVVFNDNAIGAASWAGAASSYPMGQANLIDYNIYHQAHASAALGSLNGSSVAHGATIGDLTTAWAAYSTALQYGATNDAHSSVGTITLRSPSTGDFRVTGGTAATKQGSDGQLIGAPRSRSYLINR